MSGATAATGAIAIIEEYYKHYLCVLEWLKLDPTVAHEEAVIKERSEAFLASLTHLDEKKRRKAEKRVNWLNKKYASIIKRSVWRYDFLKRSQKLAKKGYLVIHEGTTSEEYVPSEMTNLNYSFYAKRQNKIVLIATGIIFGILAITAVTLVLILT